MKLALIFAVMFGVAAGPVLAAEPERGCDPDEWGARCRWIAGGAPSLEVIASRGEEVMRFTGEVALRRYLNFMFEVRRDRRGYSITARNPEIPGQSISAPLTAADWRLFDRLRAKIERDSIAEAAEAATEDRAREADNAKHGMESVVVCADGAGIEIDTVLQGRIGRMQADDCRNAAVDPFLDRFRAFAQSKIPSCARLDANLRSLCPALTGDRMKAAAFASRLVRQMWVICEPEGGKAAAHAVFADTASLLFAGVRQSATDMQRLVCERRIYYSPSLIEYSNGMLTIAGRIDRENDRQLPDGHIVGRDQTAVYEQVWRIVGRSAKLVKWTIGPLRDV